MGNFYTDVIARSPDFLPTATVRDLGLLEPVTRAAVQAVITEAAAAPLRIRLRVTETYRSQERQGQLFRQGATHLRTVGCHHYGVAADFCKIINGVPSWAGDWAFLRTLAEKYGLISGLDWGLPHVRHSFVDPDHVQRVTIGQQDELLAGLWYPAAAISA
jgi:hypothetical protein